MEMERLTKKTRMMMEMVSLMYEMIVPLEQGIIDDEKEQ